MIVDGTKNSRIGFIQPAGGKSSEVVGDFQSFIQQADAHAKDVPAEQAAMPEPESTGRGKNTYYYGDGLIFPPADAPPEFLRAWDELLDAMPGWEKFSYICDVMSALKYGNYYGSDMSNEEMQAAIQSNFNRLGYKGTIELTLQCQKNALADNIAGGNEPIYIDYIRSLIRASEDLLMKI